MDFNAHPACEVGDIAEILRSEPSAPAVQSARLDVVPVVLSGGGGSRLWPFSTNETPKQFLPLVNSKSLFSEALDRVRGRERFGAPIVVASERHADLCEAEVLKDGENTRLILEPCARNTAPAILMAAVVAGQMYGEGALLLVMPSDHVIEDLEEFHAAIQMGEPAARDGRLVSFGIRPTAPETGYGYLHLGDEVPGAAGVKQVRQFVEKPQAEVAERMFAGGEHLWNAGIFLFRVGTLLEEAGQVAPEIAEKARQAIDAGKREGIRITPDAHLLSLCPSESIDIAVMERSSRVGAVPMSPGWSDLGSWDALASMLGNGGPVGPITTVDCESCYIRSDGVQVAALGVRDLIIVAAGGRLLVMPRGRSQEVKKLLSAMESMAA
jgi:mannose-1-phosphate guanylyltransferase/mannose-1-phosphate guanylyltransferase/mannose-6-phosphate isomerase